MSDSSDTKPEAQEQKSVGAAVSSALKETVQPFADLLRAPRALWGINLAYVIEGMVYFGMLGYLAIHFSSFIFQGVENADVHSHNMVMVLTAGITLAMLVLGFVADRYGVRFALLMAFCMLLAGRILISSAPTIFGLEPTGELWSPLHLVTMVGILLVVIGYGMYQPAAYAGVRQFTTPKTAAMGFAMLYALMNLGGWLPSFAFLLRDDEFLGLGIPGVFWVYTGFTLVALLCTAFILTKSTVKRATEDTKAETARIKAEEAEQAEEQAPEPQTAGRPEAAHAAAAGGAADAGPIKRHLWLVWVGAIVLLMFKPVSPWYYRWGESLGADIRTVVAALIFLFPLVTILLPGVLRRPVLRWIRRHPLSDAKFFFFIFALIPVQTLFTYNWLILPQYISRAFEGWIGDYFEIAANANPLLIFVAVPIITALTQRAKVYNMMIYGTFIMAAPAFLLAIGPYWWTLLLYLLIMTIGEAMWQPRFLQYAAEIAPEGRTGVYMGVAQFPWFLTKVLVPLLYSGWMMEKYCPEEGAKNTEFMWFVFGCIAITSTILLVLAKGWLGKDFKTKAD